MNNGSMAKRRIAVMIDMQWPVRHHRDVYQGILQFAEQRPDWECVLDPFAARLITPDNSAYDGVVARATKSLAMRARRAGVPVVNVWFNSPAKNIPTVHPDFTAVAQEAAEHLLQRGFGSFAYLGFQRDLADVEMLKRFSAVLANEGHACGHLFVARHIGEDEQRWQRFQDQLDRFLASLTSPAGVMVNTDLLARYLIERARCRGLRVPEDLAVLCTETWRDLCLSPAPTLTSIDLGFEQVGRKAAELLDKLLTDRSAPTAVRPVDIVGLSPRQSTDVFAVDDPLVSAALRFISDNCDQPLASTDVATAVSTTVRTLERRFKTVLDSTIAHEAIRFRVERAKRLLRDSDLLLKQVAKACGFRNAKRMRESFQRLLGTSPAEFRKQTAE